MQVTSSVIPIIEGEIGDSKCVAGDVLFDNLDRLTDGTLTPGKPDFFYGARPEQLDRRVRAELSNRIIPSTETDLPMLPNFFLELKDPEGSIAVARRQACYVGALGARGMQSLRSYGNTEQEQVYDGNAYTITSTYYGGTLTLYTCHPVQPRKPGGQPEYYMNQLRGWLLTDNLESFRQGVTAYRNARDWAKEKRDEFIEAANSRATDHHTASASVERCLGSEPSTTTTKIEIAESEEKTS